MGLTNLFNKLVLGDFSYLEAQGGMTVKYKKLIQNLENLSHEESFYEYREINYNHEMKSYLSAPNTYRIDIIYFRKGQIAVNRDLFRLIDKKDKLQIDYIRNSKSIIPISNFLPIPDHIEQKFFFDSTTNQDVIFSKLLKEIVSMYQQKYNFSETYYERIIGMNC